MRVIESRTDDGGEETHRGKCRAAALGWGLAERNNKRMTVGNRPTEAVMGV